MEIIKCIKIIDLGLLLVNEKVLVIADSHIGYEEALNKQGVLIPRLYFKDTLKRLEEILAKTGDLNVIVINGDIKHEFGTISDQEWRNTLKLMDFLSKHCKELVLVRGNHDKILGPISKKRNIKFVDNIIIGDKLILHGDKVDDMIKNKSIKTVIIGHEHPAVSLNDGAKVERYKCFLKGKFKGKNLIVQPSFNLVTEGTDVTKEKLLSPFLKEISNFEVFIVGDKVYDFGKLKEL